MAETGLSILVVTGHRPAEVRGSFVGLDTTIIELSSASIRRRIRTIRKDVRHAFETQDPDIVVLDCHELSGALVALLAARFSVPIVPRIVGDNWRGLEEDGISAGRRRGDFVTQLRAHGGLYLNACTYKRAAGFLVVSNELRHTVNTRTGVGHDRIAVVPVPATEKTFESGTAARARAAFNIGEESVLLTVTNLSFDAKLSGTITVIDEILPLLSENPDLAYVIAGSGLRRDKLLSFLDRRVNDPAVRNRIYAPGFVDQIGDLYALADAFIYVSYRDGYPNAVLEAQAAGLAVVANEAYGMCEQITDGETGLLIDPTVPGALRSRVESLLSDSQQRERLGRNAAERVRRENDPFVVSKQTAAALERFV
ncbi:glycosyltransferase family 4 protein [Halalkalirubrum salinum]|uniref:glycosyltransferase family 4 protein n=1 Tax=Halalkalirubrum salinum TaxID=2563889 RepID=UPI0014853AE4|nr:glycosyltransferase family 4 protein [Halalkalirubrum salinum]